MSGDAFYYADGSIVRLEATDQMAVDLEAARAAEVPSSVLGQLHEHGRLLRGPLALLEPGALTPDTQRLLGAAGAFRPVYRAEDGALIVVLPEVRVEVTDEQEVSRVRHLVETADVRAKIMQRGQQLTIELDHPAGTGTLDLANRIEEEIHPALSQARFVRIVPRPSG